VSSSLISASSAEAAPVSVDVSSVEDWSLCHETTYTSKYQFMSVEKFYRENVINSKNRKKVV
jgi:hypothetical protein